MMRSSDANHSKSYENIKKNWAKHASEPPVESPSEKLSSLPLYNFSLLYHACCIQKTCSSFLALFFFSRAILLFSRYSYLSCYDLLIS